MPIHHQSSRIYLDYAASTPVDPLVLRTMQPYFSGKFGNPGSLHSFGQEAIAAVDKARETIARSIGAEFREIIFTGSATEANNLALRGALAAYQLHNIKKYIATEKTSIRQKNIPPHQLPLRIIISAIEHESVLEVARSLEAQGVEVVYLPVDRRGIVDLEKLKNSLNDRTVLASVMYANNEIGTIQPIAEIAKIIREFKETRDMRQGTRKGALSSLSHVSCHYPLLHTDAAQSFQFLDCKVEDLGVDLMTLSSHKLYGPKGAGALYMRQETRDKKQGRKAASLSRVSFPVSPLLFGGGQEFGLRSGTENVPAIVGFAKAVELADGARGKESKRIGKLRDELWRGIKKIYPAAKINGVDAANEKNPARILPNMLNVYFPGQAAQDLLTKFDLEGLAVSSGSACRSRAFESSYVIEALGYDQQRAKSSIRFSLGRPTTKAEIAGTLKVIKET